MRKTLVLITLLMTVIACSSERASTPDTAVTPDQSTLVPVENAPLKTDAPNVYEFTSGPQGQTSVHIYSEDDIWIIEQNVIEADGFPTPAGRWTFTTKEKAYAYAIQNLGVNEASRNDLALDVPVFDDADLLSQNLSSTKVLWDVKNEWNWEWEIKYAKWMRDNLHPDFFEKLGIANDCADAYYQTRMIFAYENALPVTFRLAGGGAVFTQNVIRPEWKKLKTNDDWRKNERFLKAIDYIANTTYTHTLGKDSYPIEISTDGLIEGAAYLYLDKHSGHTLLVNEINLGKNASSKTRLPMYTLNSTVPKTVRPLYESMFYESQQPKKSPYGNTGFIRFRWPKSSGSKNLVDAEDMPYYSEEQYDESFMTAVSEEGAEYQNFSITVFKRLNPDFDPTLRITEGITEVTELLQDRAQVVIEGYEACKKGCKEGGADYENWSTPSRDGRLKALMQDLEKYQSALYSFKDVVAAWENALKQDVLTLEGVPYLFSHVKWTFDNAFFDSNPNKTPGVRWGLSPEAFADASFEQLNPLLLARKGKINEKNDCNLSPTCLVFSDEYLAKSTFVEDQDMQRSIETRNYYCEQAGAANCEKFKIALAGLTTIAPGHANFLETWEKIQTLNSDPRVSEDQRWGGLPANLDALVVDGAYYSIGRYGTKVLVYKNTYPQSELAMLDIASKSFQTLEKYPKSGSHVMDTETGMLVSINNADYTVKITDLNTMATQSLALPNVAPVADDYGFYASITIIDKRRFVAAYQGKLTAFETDENDRYQVITSVANYNLMTKSHYAYAAVNLEKVDGAPSKWQVSVIDLFDTAKPEIVVDVNGFLGKSHPSYISFDGTMTAKAAMFSWSRYDVTPSLNGKFIVNLETGAVTESKELPEYVTFLGSNVVTTTTYSDTGDDTKTHFYFLSDDLKVEKQISMEGSCNNCYQATQNLQVGNGIYNIDLTAKTLVQIAAITVKGGKSASARIDTTYGKYAVVTYYNESTYYSSLVDMTTGKASLTSENMGIGYTEGGFFPTLSMSKSVTVGSGETAKYYSMNLTLDLEKPMDGPLATPAYSDFEGGDGEFEPEFDEDGNPITAAENVIPAPSDVDFTFQLLDPSALIVKNDPVTMFTVSYKKTVFIFR